MVKSLRKSFGIEYIYAWHGLSAYWSGVAPASEAPGMAKYNARILFAQPTPGLAEIEPSMSWNPSVISGVGAPEDPAVLFNDMHSYLASSGAVPSLPWSGVSIQAQPFDSPFDPGLLFSAHALWLQISVSNWMMPPELSDCIADAVCISTIATQSFLAHWQQRGKLIITTFLAC